MVCRIGRKRRWRREHLHNGVFPGDRATVGQRRVRHVQRLVELLIALVWRQGRPLERHGGGLWREQFQWCSSEKCLVLGENVNSWGRNKEWSQVKEIESKMGIAITEAAGWEQPIVFW